MGAYTAHLVRCYILPHHLQAATQSINLPPTITRARLCIALICSDVLRERDPACWALVATSEAVPKVAQLSYTCTAHDHAVRRMCLDVRGPTGSFPGQIVPDRVAFFRPPIRRKLHLI